MRRRSNKTIIARKTTTVFTGLLCKTFVLNFNMYSVVYRGRNVLFSFICLKERKIKWFFLIGNANCIRSDQIRPLKFENEVSWRKIIWFDSSRKYEFRFLVMNGFWVSDGRRTYFSYPVPYSIINTKQDIFFRSGLWLNTNLEKIRMDAHIFSEQTKLT